MEYCPAIFFKTFCYPAEYWSFFWSATQVLLVVITALIGIPKIYLEVKSIKKAREAENEQKRTDFFLAQHRRLFDDETLYAVLRKVDGDEPSLAEVEMWDDKRKFLTFIEEIELLARAEKINPNVAYYMFGYYAAQARDGNNFCVGIDLSEEYWGLFFSFCRKADEFLIHLKENPNEVNNLKI
jgi:hypothetical protein